jgi:hypothetical protein
MKKIQPYLWYWPELLFGLLTIIIAAQLAYTGIKFGPLNFGFVFTPILQGVLGYLFGLLGTWIHKRLLPISIGPGISFFTCIVLGTVLLTGTEILHYRPKFDDNDFRHMGMVSIGIGYAYGRKVRFIV